MTVKEAYDIALSLDQSTEEQDDSLYAHAVNLTNTWLAEVLDNENAIRIMEHMAPFTSAPILQRITDTVPYSDKLTRSALPFFLAHQLLKDDADNVWAARYYDMYINAVQMATPFIPTPMRDCWRW